LKRKKLSIILLGALLILTVLFPTSGVFALVLDGEIIQDPNNPDTWESGNLLPAPVFLDNGESFVQDFVFEDMKHIKMSDETGSDEFVSVHIIGEVLTQEVNFVFLLALTDMDGNIIPGTGPLPGLAADGVGQGPFDIPVSLDRDALNQGEMLIIHDVFVEISVDAGNVRIDHLSVDLQADTLEEGIWGPVGGTMIPIDTTALLLTGAQTTAAWMIPVIVSAIGIAIVIARKF